MKIDGYDNTLVCENEDLQTVLSYFKEYRKIPECLELALLKIVSEQIALGHIDYKTIDEYLMALPNNFINKTIKDINAMFSSFSKVTYRVFQSSL